MDFTDLSDYIRASKDALDLFRGALSLLPKGANRDEIERRLADAEKVLARSDAKLAKELGMYLCQCTFPPQIMRSKGHHSVHDVEMFACPACNKQHPSEHKIQQYDRLKAYNEGLNDEPDWITARR